MNWLNRGEAKFGHLAIPGLIRIIVAFNALVFLLIKLHPEYLHFLDLQPRLIMEGQVWRLITYIFIPQFGGILGDLLSAFLYISFLLFLGDTLERAIGAFRFNLFYLLGMVGVTISAFWFGSDFSSGILNTSLLFALARYAPDLVIYIMFILPVKIKWLAWAAAVPLVLFFASLGWDYRGAILFSLLNYILFFGADHVREARHRSEVAARRRVFDAKAKEGASATLHECVVCHRTESSDRYLDFRVARDGQEYCVDHLPSQPPQPPSIA